MLPPPLTPGGAAARDALGFGLSVSPLTIQTLGRRVWSLGLSDLRVWDVNHFSVCVMIDVLEAIAIQCLRFPLRVLGFGLEVWDRGVELGALDLGLEMQVLCVFELLQLHSNPMPSRL
jgi:hypothetical protein